MVSLILVLSLIPGLWGSCTFKSPSWSPGTLRVSLASSSHPNKVLVDWSALIVNKGCVDQYSVWVWKDGQQKAQGKKYLISDKNTLTKMVDIEPCLYHNFLVELKPGKATGTVRFNSATLPSLEKDDVLKHVTVGYYKDPRTGQFNLGKASVKIQSKFLTFLKCIKHIEISGTQIAGAKAVKSTLAGPSTPSLTKTSEDAWEPYGTGRQVGGMGRPADRKWGYHREREPFRRSSSTSSSSTSSSSTSSSSTSSSSSSTSSSTGWGYSVATKKPNKASKPASQPESTKWGPSPFTKEFLRMKETPSKKPLNPVTSAPPFKSDIVEITVDVEPCKEYQFEMKIISPQNAVVASIPGIILQSLSDLPDYVPPPLTAVVEVNFAGGKHTLTTQKTSPVPETCLIDYMEAVDTFANRVEHVANNLHSAASLVKSGQDRIQDNVEMTQSASLAKLGCTCTSPRLEVTVGSSDSLAPDYAGVYLYQGVQQGKPYFKLDLENRSIPGASSPVRRRKRFIGRVDGGGTTTTRTPINYGVPQGSYSGGSFSTKYPSWREYLDISTQSPGTKYSNRYSSSSSSSSSSYVRTSSSNTRGPSVGCPDENMNLQLRRNAELLTKVSSWQECARKCAEKGSCQNWVWNRASAGIYANNCALMEGFGNKIADSNSVAGRWDCNYKGSSSQGSSVTTTGAVTGGVIKPAGGSSVPVVEEVKPRYLYWDQKAKQWLISTQVGGSSSLAELSSPTNSVTKCPADNQGEVWRAKTGGQEGRVVCSPGL